MVFTLSKSGKAGEKAAERNMIRLQIQAKKNKPAQYILSGIIAVVVLVAWISLPLISNSSLDSSVSAGNPFKSKVTDIGSLMGDIPSGGWSQGSPLSGEMTDNPATSGESMVSSLFQSGVGDEEPSAGPDAAEGAGGPGMDSGMSGGPSGDYMGPASGGSQGERPKLNPQASFAGGGSNSSSASGPHSRFFGGDSAKPNFAPATGSNANVAREPAKNGALMSMLSNSAEKSRFAAKTGNLYAAHGGAASAFERTAKADTSDLTTDLENKSAVSGLSVGQAARDLKTNDPKLNSSKVTPPAPKPVEDKESTEEEIKKMLMQMIIQSTLGEMFGSVGQLLGSAINPNYKPEDTYKPIGTTGTTGTGGK